MRNIIVLACPILLLKIQCRVNHHFPGDQQTMIRASMTFCIVTPCPVLRGYFTR